MTRKVGICLGLVCGLAMTVGCSSEKRLSISSLEPYVGPYPSKARALPSPLTRSPQRSWTPKANRGRGPNSGQGGWVPSRGISSRWDCVVIHHSGSDKSTPAGMRDWHVNGRGWDALGYHFVIGNGVGYADGRIFVGERWHKQMHGAHCKTASNRYNDHGIGICLIGNFEDHGPSQRQIEALARLTSFLCERCGISTSRVLTHEGVTHRTACPGRHFALRPVLELMSKKSVRASSR